MMDENEHFLNIYRRQGKKYHELISYEDADHNLLPALQSITSFKGKNLLDLGSGTGRIPLLFPRLPIICIDFHRNMLLENQRLQLSNSSNLIQADMRKLPLHDNYFDIVTAGWAIGHFTGWYPNDWREQVTRVLKQAIRTLKPNGWIIILETMSTGSAFPAPPTPSLSDYYSLLEDNWGFNRIVIQTDYQFNNLDEAAGYAEFFFGQELAELVRFNHWIRLPEWTGIWSVKI